VSTDAPPAREPGPRGGPNDRKLAALQDRLDSEIRALRTGEDWARWLRAAARMPSQDFAGVLLISAQRPAATMVAGYQAWRAAGRQGHGGRGAAVRCGVRGIIHVGRLLERRSRARSGASTSWAGPLW